MYIEQGLIVFLSVTRIQDDRTSRDRLIVLLQSSRWPFIIYPTSLQSEERVNRTSDLGVVFLQQRFIMHAAL